LVGAAVALLVAPQSGEETRTMLRDRSLQMRGRVEDTVSQARSRVEEAAEQARSHAEDIQRKGLEYVEEQKGRVQRTSRAVTRAAKDAWNEDEGANTSTAS